MADEETATTEEVKEETAEETTSSEGKGAGLRFKKSRGVCRKCRRAGEKLFLKGERCFSAKCSYTRRSYAPGQHGNKGQRRVSQYGLQLREKQKLAAIYALRERQLLKYFSKAARTQGKTGDNLMSLLERRLDNVAYRAGFFSSRREARQGIRNALVTLQNKKVDIPSILVKENNIIGLKISQKQKKADKAKSQNEIPNWIQLAKDGEIKIVRLPNRADIAESIDEQLVVEFYSK